MANLIKLHSGFIVHISVECSSLGLHGLLDLIRLAANLLTGLGRFLWWSQSQTGYLYFAKAAEIERVTHQFHRETVLHAEPIVIKFSNALE